MSDSNPSGQKHRTCDQCQQQMNTPTDIVYPVPPDDGSWITDHAWICGLAGAVTVVLLAAFYKFTNALENGVVVFDLILTDDRKDSILLALVFIAAVMLAVEWVRLWLRDRKTFFSIHPDLKKGRYGSFFGEALENWILYLILLGLTVVFFRTANEYGYANKHEYYQIWFRFIELAWFVYLWGGLPYVLITRAVKHDPLADRRDFSALTLRGINFLISFIPGFKRFRPEFNEIDKKAARGLLVKVFFTPLMTIFFADQFPHLVNNIGFVIGTVPGLIAGGHYTHNQFNIDLFNVGLSFIFSVDVALAWVGYTISSRWVNNSTVSAEPTMLGWLVCLICYPPFQRILGVYYGAPSERDILQFSHQWIVTVFAFMMLFSYFVYMAATLWFGVRFSNLTNRGIIRKGPYAFIRHPAYASKNFSWWCVMFPVVVYNAVYTGIVVAGVQIIGLVFMTWLYYMRALTEERHLSVDPYYQAYCRQVKYRFIPGVF